MSSYELMASLGFFVVYLMSTYGYGTTVVRLLGQKISLVYSGAYLMIGMGILSNLSLGLGLLGQFSKQNLVGVIILGLILGLFGYRDYHLIRTIDLRKLGRVIKQEYVSTLLLLFGVMVIGSLTLSAMQPPHASDELHYHFPQARQMAMEQRINWSLDGHYFYGNIPKMVDVLFGVGLSLQGYQTAHLLNFGFLVGFVLLVYGLIYQKYGYRSGVYAILFLLLFEDYTWNATVGFVDSATSSLEIGALLLLAKWREERKTEGLIMSGLLLGLSLGSKYSPLPTALYLSVIIFVISVAEKTWKYILLFGMSAILTGGYWYLKNLIMFGNPFYPMYFGHRNVPQESYDSLMEAIWQWEPKTLSVFLQKLTRWRTYSEITSYLAIYAAPISLLLYRKDRFLTVLGGFFVIYLPYWFLMATHQTRFLLPAILVANIMLGILLAKIPNKLIVALITLLLLLGIWVRPYPERNLLNHYLWMKLHAVERQYALGNISESEYLSREFGCQYNIVDYLNSQTTGAKVIDNWSLYFAPSVSYFSQNKFTQAKDLSTIKAENYEYYYVKEQVKEAVLKDDSEYSHKNKEIYLEVEQKAIKQAELIYEKDDCRVYKLIKTD